MEIKISLYRGKGDFSPITRRFELDRQIVEAFRPVDHVSDPMLRILSPRLPEPRITREQAAEEIASRLTCWLLDEMKQNDTYNGYSK